MLVKLNAVIIVAACLIVQSKTAAMRKQNADVAAVLVRDSNTGQLRFLGNGFGSNQINQLITNKQDFLERLRPGGGNWGSSGVDIITQAANTAIDTPTGTTNIDTITNTDTGLTSTGDGLGVTGTGTGVTATGTNPTTGIRVRPIVVNANRGNSNGRRKPNRRRGNGRRRGNRRRGGNKRPKIIVIRERP